jgi:hypothetical protein
MKRGYVRLWRKSIDNGWLQNHSLWVFWSYCLLKATHQEITLKVGFQEVNLTPGQFVFGLHKAASDLKMSVWKIRASIDFLKKAGNITIKTTNKYSIITVMNWGVYQGDRVRLPQANPQTNHKQTATNKHNKNNNTPAEISRKISDLKSRYSSLRLIDEAINGLATTRKKNRIADTVILAQLEKWKRYPADQVEAAIRIYLEKDYAAQGKREEYLLGIIRGEHKKTKFQHKPSIKPHYRQQSFDFENETPRIMPDV